MQDAQWKLTGRQREVSCTGFLCKGVSRMSPCGLTGLLLAPWWARLQHYASLTGLPLLSIIVLSKTHTHMHTLSYRLAHMNTRACVHSQQSKQADSTDIKKLCSLFCFFLSVHEREILQGKKKNAKNATKKKKLMQN